MISDAAPLARRLETPLVGRERERQRLWRDYEDAVADRTCRLFTLLGPAGIGKSRLVADFLERVGDVGRRPARAVPLVRRGDHVLAARPDPASRSASEPDAIIGTSPPETQLAFRRLLEARAAERPQVVVLDDLQWAEPVFVDLVEHIADLSRDAPIFLLCVARTELLDSRPEWGGGKLNATSLLLEPLGADECAELMELLVSDASLTDDLRERITTASAGNPLYVEEMLAMVREHGGEGEIVVPPTIHALLQARIDSLDGDVRLVMERGSVEGEVFHRGSVAVLSPDPVRPAVESHLATLVRKELIRSTSPTFPEDEGFRFRHLLIRDAAYESLPKATRAELHERFADWLFDHDLIERDEIVGYHLEQAHRYRIELDPGDPARPRLAERSSERLGAAGVGAMDRGDWGAARNLLRRARRLLPEGSDARAALAPELSIALQETGEIEEATQAAEEATRASDPVIRARGMVAQADILESRLERSCAWRPGHGATRRGRSSRPPTTISGSLTTGARAATTSGGSVAARSRVRHGRAGSGTRTRSEPIESPGSCEAMSSVGSCSEPPPSPTALPRVEAALDQAREGSLEEAAALRASAQLLAFSGSIDEGASAHRPGCADVP